MVAGARAGQLLVALGIVIACSGSDDANPPAVVAGVELTGAQRTAAVARTGASSPTARSRRRPVTSRGGTAAEAGAQSGTPKASETTGGAVRVAGVTVSTSAANGKIGDRGRALARPSSSALAGKLLAVGTATEGAYAAPRDVAGPR